MANNSNHDLIDTLETLLDTERAALLKGDVDKINRIAVRKEDLVARVSALANVPQRSLIPVQEKLRRNRDLLEHALEGIRAAANRMSDMRKARESLHTYDQKGKLRDIASASQRSVEKRA